MWMRSKGAVARELEIGKEINLCLLNIQASQNVGIVEKEYEILQFDWRECRTIIDGCPIHWWKICKSVGFFIIFKEVGCTFGFTIRDKTKLKVHGKDGVETEEEQFVTSNLLVETELQGNNEVESTTEVGLQAELLLHGCEVVEWLKV